MRKKPFVVFQVTGESNEKETLKVYIEDLRKMLKKAKPGKDAKEVSFTIQTSTRTLTLNMKISDIRKLIKKSDLQEQIVPMWMSKYLKDLTYIFSTKNIGTISGRDNESGHFSRHLFSL